MHYPSCHARWSPEPAFFGISGSVLSIFKLKTEIHSHQVSSNFLYSSWIMKHVAECFSQREFLSFSPKSCSRLSFRIWWFSNMSIWSYGRVEIKQLGSKRKWICFFCVGRFFYQVLLWIVRCVAKYKSSTKSSRQKSLCLIRHLKTVSDLSRHLRNFRNKLNSHEQ